jgi:superfamily II DNA helicase RecQ
VVLTLNPLNNLGNNQVEEKISAGFTAINLNKLNFNQTTAEAIADRKYQFVYLSPEIFLNNKLWEEVYFSSLFQN